MLGMVLVKPGHKFLYINEVYEIRYSLCYKT